jgi:hypothetical protein
MQHLRSVTTVPQQALFMLNSAFLFEQTCALVASFEFPWRRIRSRKAATLPAFVWAWRSPGSSSRPGVYCCARGETRERRIRTWRGAAAVDESLTAWEKYAQVLLATNEFAFVD